MFSRPVGPELVSITFNAVLSRIWSWGTWVHFSAAIGWLDANPLGQLLLDLVELN